MHLVHARAQGNQKRVLYPPGLRLKDIGSYELSCRFWETNPGPLQQQQALLTIKPPLHSLLFPKVTYHLVVKDKESSKTVQDRM